MTGFICHDAYYDRLSRLSDSEVGHLFRQLMLYHAGRNEEMTELSGMEGLAFDFIVADIDRIEEKCEKNRANGAKGGRQNKRAKADGSELKRTEANGSELKQTEAYKVIVKEKENKTISSYIDDDDAHEIQSEQNRVLDAAEDAGFKMSNSVRAALIALYADHGLQKMLDGLKSCSEHGAANLAYLRAVLRGEPRKEKPKVTAQQYEQRDYTGMQDTLSEQQDAEIMEFLNRKGAS